MTAIILLACHSVRELLDLSDALWHNAFDIDRSLTYYRNKRRLQLFQFHCRELWLRQAMIREADLIDFGDEADAESSFYGSQARTVHQRFHEAERQQLEPLADAFEDIEVIDGKQFDVRNRRKADPVPTSRRVFFQLEARLGSSLLLRIYPVVYRSLPVLPPLRIVGAHGGKSSAQLLGTVASRPEVPLQ